MNLFKQTLPLTLISSFRFFGFFVVIPVISTYAISLGATPLMVGLAVGGYALTQIIFQTPFGLLGDKMDKRTLIAIGLLIFIFGSALCAYTDDIVFLILGRMLQGCGAISSVLSALIADLTPIEHRTKAMAMMGGGISLAFLLAMIVGPIIDGYYGIKPLFWITIVLAFIALVILFFKVPKCPHVQYSYDQNLKQTHYLKNPNLWLMHLSAFLQKALCNFVFVIAPLVLWKDFNFGADELWKFYTPAGIMGILAMAPASIIAEKYGQYKKIMIAGILAFISCFFLLALSDHYRVLWLFIMGLIVFFIGFNMHEPIMQSLTSKYPSSSQRSSALGLFTTFGFLGSFLGAILGGVLYSYVGLFYLSIGTGIVCLLWIMTLILLLENPKKLKTLFLHSNPPFNPSQIEGVFDYYHAQNTFVIIYDPNIINETTLKEKLT